MSVGNIFSQNPFIKIIMGPLAGGLGGVSGLVSGLASGIQDFEKIFDSLGIKGAKDRPANPLPAPGKNFSAGDLGAAIGGLSPGAVIMGLITKDASEQRKLNKELIYAQTESIVNKMHEQADEMRDKAAIQLVTGLISGACSMAGPEGKAAAAAVDSIGGFMASMSDAKIKDMDADIERMRGDRDALKEFNNSWDDLIKKALSTTDAIQQGQNQTLSRILA